ncbi:hypothetical protein W97_05649 [Coniosporium apollinis CBS 100218]|uniref:Carotenoid oxygenase n=1 Tax=Coniosporium apollinis (strain CBS 100218) TaxID=1168221 RepID=R7YX69_CONA1|nr:uncharacterized protein W97_05649 [Coniosporium apollinis CBS 100218]EON66256.1 hypothetical protein W97_05649 [Coniosporium apollinis CBS 100218]
MSLKRKRGQKHPYLSGNFAPIQQTRPLTPCTYEGTIPEELAGGQYVRNGGNPLLNEDLGRDAHWFDGDGMLSGVAFRRSERDGSIRPEFVNQYIHTDLYLSTLATPSLRRAILPSIATLVNPLSRLVTIMLRIFRAVFLVLLSHLPGSEHAIKRISVSNTAIYYHDGRALATCESGPPMRIQLPGLETVGWYDGNTAEGEGVKPDAQGFGGTGLFSFLKESTTGHPKVDPVTGELVLFHNTFVSPYCHYSLIPDTSKPSATRKIINAPVPGMRSAKMMHDFGVSRSHAVIMDLPLSLDPLNLLKNKPIVTYDSSRPSRFGVFPRTEPHKVRWFETSACCIFHTANAWDSHDANGNVTTVNLLACRLTSASLVFSAGNIAALQPMPTQETVDAVKRSISFFDHYDDDDAAHASAHANPSVSAAYDRAPALESPRPTEKTPLLSSPSPSLSPPPPATVAAEEEEQCRLYHYTFSLSHPTPTITAQYALSALPFEFPTLNPTAEMAAARYIYGCSTTAASFGAALGRAAKIDVLLKIDATTLIARAATTKPAPVTGCVDTRAMSAVLSSTDATDPIRAFRMPAGWCAQEARFVPRAHSAAEDDGYLLFYAFDEAQLDVEGECPPTAVSELWVLDARDMRSVVCRVSLPQRVPYGLHGNWFGEEAIAKQRGVESVRVARGPGAGGEGSWAWRAWMGGRRFLERAIA